ncbi:SDR family NAD(P)-dependent oxidoreductase [Amycolatopsis sp. NBC_01488]|uniref:SDR family NAD(P)-dependent oxidoreductase n=1 Tax=Amycolatopsis sp. NBC_01488 TaxID=2903563 RepID=UPI002E2CF496|nr:SDR family NAD(P)-dependent oxidoreductase [Amycolatopsis sp. NBC_01488]
MSGQVVVVTGGAHGFGQHVVAALAEAGARLVVTGRDDAALAALSRAAHSAGWALVTQAGDVQDQATATAVVDRAVETFGRVDVLVNNAGITGPIGPTWEVDSDDWWQAMEVNAHGSLLFIRAALPVMADQGAGTIVNIVSSAGLRRFPHLSAYSVSKAAVIKLGENLGRELATADTGVSVFSLHPGVLRDSGIARNLLRGDHTGRWLVKTAGWVREQIRTGRSVEAAVAAQAVVALCSGKFEASSGSYLEVDDVLARLTPETAQVPDQASTGARGTRHYHETELRFSDLDWQGHINNVSMVGYLQEAQIRLLDPDRRKIFQEADESFVVAAHNVDYLQPLQFREEPVVVETRIVDMGRSKIVLNSEVRDDQNIYARSSSTYVAYDTVARTVRPLTAHERREFARYTAKHSRNFLKKRYPDLYRKRVKA